MQVRGIMQCSIHGVLTDILEIRYTNDMKYILFKGDWIDNKWVNNKMSLNSL